MSYPLCSARGREHIHRPPLHHPDHHRRRLRFSASGRIVGHHPALRGLGDLRPSTRPCLLSADLFRMGGRVVDCARLESVCAAMHRGFESLPIRHFAKGKLETPAGMKNAVRAEAAGRDRSSTARPIPPHPPFNCGDLNPRVRAVRQVAAATNPSPSAILQ